jgi:hypothetical protein
VLDKRFSRVQLELREKFLDLIVMFFVCFLLEFTTKLQNRFLVANRMERK